ncbi:hypothetical protein [Pseudoruegeria sp. HB172150]|uniref:hypothetical protein n=1 Tax=Pseudoruegeria sp. HB172150 TaxID=2721164 RepID=UPI0015575452|nr:hypothetical protein [Pseudoruegeria sp. HB172150]
MRVWSVRTGLALAGLPVLLSACAPTPMTLERAERQCREEARLSDGVAGNVRVGVGSRGPSAGGSVTVTNRILSPQSQGDFMQECIARTMRGEPRPTTVGITIGASR